MDISKVNEKLKDIDVELVEVDEELSKYLKELGMEE